MSELELWKARAEAALPLINAAVKLTQGTSFDMSEKQSVLVSRDQYEKLRIAVEDYISAAKRESEKSE